MIIFIVEKTETSEFIHKIEKNKEESQSEHTLYALTKKYRIRYKVSL